MVKARGWIACPQTAPVDSTALTPITGIPEEHAYPEPELQRLLDARRELSAAVEPTLVHSNPRATRCEREGRAARA